MAVQGLKRPSTLVTVCVFLVCLGNSPVIAHPPLASRLPDLSQGPGLLSETEKAQQPVPYTIEGEHRQVQVTNIIRALTSTGKFNVMAELFQEMDITSVTPHTTWFLPTDEGFVNGTDFVYDTFMALLDYHIVRTPLPYRELSTLSVGTQLQTFTRGKVCLVTASSPLAVTIDNATVVFRDLFWDGYVAVHGIDDVMNPISGNETEVEPSPSRTLPKSSSCLSTLVATSLFVGGALLY